MDFATVNGLKLRRPFSESRRNNIWRFLTNMYSVKQDNWILDEPTTLLDDRGTSNTMFKEYIMKYFLIDKGRVMPDTVLETHFHKLMLKGNNHTLLVFGPNLFKEQAFFSCDIEEAGKELLNNRYLLSSSRLRGFVRGLHSLPNILYKGYSYNESYKPSDLPSKPNRLLYLPPSQDSNIPLQAFFMGFLKRMQ
ncbi:uncharacterized protein NDAI_0C00110 [Naumovozyma dairenensis CBS 421]|uniref:Uncharacterized protein n=1 Tax=Naumovozyma dairenensis (strain ATCC 10597 / BCRC 20456 / CBS 421 / NBRC 0211 / NRRL Y-12639) TaxID=1071378 RepID=G0W7B0_NAUDC|nr:hypothetical protein NDAI_0C00110 [Naumovozyma dairenensis CBS 421]CCD23671.1 hypothetical protein NDAI_0C00110 [Naumovozyma dairenensis CBS 421]